MSIKNNIQSLQEILNKVNALPEAGTDLPALDNEGLASDLLTGKQLIDDEGNIVTGSMPNNGNINQTFDGINVKSVTIPQGYAAGGTVSLDGTIDNEVDIQEDLLIQVAAALDGKAAGGGTAEAITVTINSTNWRGSMWYTDASSNFHDARAINSGDTITISCLKNSIIVFSGYGFKCSKFSDFEIDYMSDMLYEAGLYGYVFSEDTTLRIDNTEGMPPSD